MLLLFAMCSLLDMLNMTIGKVTQLPDKVLKTTDAAKSRKRKANASVAMAAVEKLTPLVNFCNKECK